ncbi:MAG: iron-sulfur cluster assembly scaffold protein [Gemmatimonadota bacterium]|nr:MAG: iron-sulfur cluster assembly scaffold protein [Gemmatimonadota bacterium]
MVAKLPYSQKLLDHFQHPHNVGEIENADGIGELTSDVCGDLTVVYISVKDDRIVDIKFKTFGCAAAIASSSILTDMALGKMLDEALRITDMDIVKAMDNGIPKEKIHCSVLAADALHQAITNYRSKDSKDREATFV